MLNREFLEKLRISENDLSKLKGRVKLYHNEKCDGNYAISGETIKVQVSFPRSILICEPSIVVIDGYTNKKIFEKKGLFKEENLNSETYEFIIDNFDELGLYFYFFKLKFYDFSLYGYMDENRELAFSFLAPKEPQMYQITVAKQRSSQTKISGIIYHIFVDRFFKYGSVLPSRNAVMIENWDSKIPEYPKYPGAYMKNNTFFGGNLYGIIEKLEYLKSLGVSIIYLSPIFESASNHKYDTGDYEKIDDMFGGDEALKSLIEEAKKLNIGIIFDGVFNHTGADSKYFNKFATYDSIGAFQSKESKYYDWYRFSSYPDKYDCWWGIDILPRIYYDKGNAEEYFLGDSGIVNKWMRRGILGFRLDVVDELSDSFVEKMRDLISKENKNALLYGEVWEDASNKTAYGKRKKYYLGTELSGVMNYPLRNGIISYIRRKNEAELKYSLNTVMMNMPIDIRNIGMNLLGSHDTERILTALGGCDPSGKSNDELSNIKMQSDEYLIAKKRLMSAYTILCTLPGIPTVYYGDEAGLEGYSDPFNRRTFPWGKEDRELLFHYRKMGKIRTQNEVLFDGDFFLLHLDRKIFVFERKKEDERIITVYNNGTEDARIEFSTVVTDLYEDKSCTESVLKSETAYVFKTREIKDIIIGCY